MKVYKLEEVDDTILSFNLDELKKETVKFKEDEINRYTDFKDEEDFISATESYGMGGTKVLFFKSKYVCRLHSQCINLQRLVDNIQQEMKVMLDRIQKSKI